MGGQEEQISARHINSAGFARRQHVAAWHVQTKLAAVAMATNSLVHTSHHLKGAICYIMMPFVLFHRKKCISLIR